MNAMHSPSRPRLRFLLLALLCMALLCMALGAQEQGAQEQEKPQPPVAGAVLMLEIRDAIGPATSDFFQRTLERAEEQNARLLLLQLDTPGGLDTAMRDMIQAILAASVPVAIYVAPSGARAASAGTYLLYASHIAAMAPATNLGAATPVQIGGGQPRGRPADKEPKPGEEPKQDEAPDSSTAMERKAINDSVAYIRGLAELRGRNADWAESAVRTAESLSATQAREQNVIDVIAADVPDLLRQIDGRTVKTRLGDVKLATAGAAVELIEADWRTRLLSVLTNPNVAYLLMLAGVYGLLLEGYNPGALLPGVVGAICLVLALYAFQVLSVNYAGLGLILLGVALIVAEAFAPSFGVLGIGGVVAFVIGSVILFDADVPGFRIAQSLIAGVGLTAAVLMLLTVTYFARSRRKPVVTGVEQLLQEPAVALEDFTTTGLVRIRSETWQARTQAPVRQGQRLRVLRVDGLTLEVTPEQ